jgi:hypothetical protein
VSGEFLLILGEGAEVTLDLDAVPEFLGLAEEGTEAHGHGGRDGTAGVNDLIDGAWCDTDGTSHRILRNTHGDEVFLQKDLAGCDGRLHGNNVLRYRGASMVIANFDLCWAVFVPCEENSPLVIDADRMVARQIPFHGFKTISGRHGKVLKGLGTIHLDELPQCDPCDRAETAVRLAHKKFVSVLVCE